MYQRIPKLALPGLILALALFLAAGFTKAEPWNVTGYEPGQPIPTVEVETDVPNPFHTFVGIDFVKPIVADNLLRVEPRDDVMLIDARPKRPRFDRGHIPTAVSLPDGEFEERADEVLPEDK